MCYRFIKKDRRAITHRYSSKSAWRFFFQFNCVDINHFANKRFKWLLAADNHLKCHSLWWRTGSVIESDMGKKSLEIVVELAIIQVAIGVLLKRIHCPQVSICRTVDFTMFNVLFFFFPPVKYFASSFGVKQLRMSFCFRWLKQSKYNWLIFEVAKMGGASRRTAITILKISINSANCNKRSH